MTISDDALKARCAEVFGDELDPERRAAVIAALESLERGHPSLLERLSPEAEPAGHAGFLRSLTRGE